MPSGWIAYLPRERWTTCRRCGGTGSYEMSGDLHRSGGIVPCCSGWETTETISAEEYRRREQSGQLYDPQGRRIAAPRAPDWQAPVVVQTAGV